MQSLAVLAVLSSARAGAEPTKAASAAVLFRGAPPADAARWRARVQAQLGAQAIVDPAALASEVRGVQALRLALVTELEALLARARSQTAALAEADALGTLAEAARSAEQIGDVPGAAQWNAEIQLGIGVTAAQAGMSSLAEQAFRRAAILDPERRLLSAEASPAIVELYERVEREVALSAGGELEVQVGAPRAQVFLDDVAQGLAPVRLRTSVGRHVLRIEAPGHRAYGALIDVLPGLRPALRVEPAPEPAVLAAQELQRAAQAGDYAAVVIAAQALARAGAVLGSIVVVELAPGTPRALLVRCDGAGCRGPLRMAGSELTLEPRVALDATRLARDRSWLRHVDTAQPSAAATPWWRRWYVWGGLAVAAGVVASLAIALDAEPPPSRLDVVIDVEQLRR